MSDTRSPPQLNTGDNDSPNNRSVNNVNDDNFSAPPSITSSTGTPLTLFEWTACESS